MRTWGSCVSFPEHHFYKDLLSMNPFSFIIAYPMLAYPISISCSAVWLYGKNKPAFFCLTDLYFHILINRINAMVKKRSLDILDKEFVHLFTPIAWLPSRILQAFLWNYGLVYGSQDCPSLEEQLWNPSLKLWNPSLLSNPSLISFDRKQSQNPVVARWSEGRKITLNFSPHSFTSHAFAFFLR